MKDEIIHVFFTINDAYAKYLSVTLISILSHTNSKLSFHVLSSDISEDSKNKLNQLKKIKNFDIEFLNVRTELFDKVPNYCMNHISKEGYYRLLISSLKPDLNKCIYLDTDLVFIDDIEKLWKINLKDSYIAAVPDQFALIENSWTHSFPIPKNYLYINSGVMVINLKKWREDSIEKKAFENLIKYERLLQFPDQDILNITCSQKVQYLPLNFNSMPTQGYIDKESEKKAFKNPLLVHWAGWCKPWNNHDCPMKNCFWDYAPKSPFFIEIQEVYNQKPAVSVIVPVYNTEKYLPQCLDSLIHQTLHNIEVIVVDDGSTDNSASIIKKYAELDSRIRPILKKNEGTSIASRIGLQEAKGEYIGFLDSDDWVEQDMFEVLYQTAKQNDVDIVRSGAFISEWSDHSEIHPYFPIDKCNRIITNSLEIPEFVMTHVCHWASIYRHEFLNKNEINFSKSEKIVIHDFYFSFQCWIESQSFYIIPAAFVHYRRTNPNAVQNSGKKHFLHLIKAHMETRNVMRQLKEKATSYHWSIKSLVEFQHIMADINGINELPFSFVMGCSKMFCENLQKGYITKNNLRGDFLKTYKFIAYHPVIYWLNMQLKFWCEKHQMDGKNIYWRFLGLYKKIVTNQFITKYCLGIPFSKNINYEALLNDVNNRLKILEKKLNKEGR